MRSASSARAVSMITGSSERSRIQRQTARPSVPGQHQVEDDEVRMLVLDERNRRVAVAGLERAVALAAQVLDDDLADDRLVIDDKHRRHPRIVA